MTNANRNITNHLRPAPTKAHPHVPKNSISYTKNRTTSSFRYTPMWRIIHRLIVNLEILHELTSADERSHKNYYFSICFFCSMHHRSMYLDKISEIHESRVKVSLQSINLPMKSWPMSSCNVAGFNLVLTQDDKHSVAVPRFVVQFAATSKRWLIDPVACVCITPIGWL